MHVEDESTSIRIRVPPSGAEERVSNGGLVRLRRRGEAFTPVGGATPAPGGATPAPGGATPPPEAVSRFLEPGVELEKLVRDIESLESLVASWDEQQKNTVRALESALDALHKEALVRLIRGLKADPAAASALRRAVSDPVVYGVLRHHDIIRPSLHERVETALASVRPFLAAHGGDVQLVEVNPPHSVTIRLLGSCDGCAAAGLTLSEGVEKAIQSHCPEIQQIKKAKGVHSGKAGGGADYVSPFARAEDAGWIRVARIEDIPERDLTVIEIPGHSLLLSRVDDGVRCFENACAHLGMPMDMGAVEDGVLTCPHHGFRYDLESGECLTTPGVQLQTHAVRISGGEVEVKLS